jgi:signal transduction histidine kinase
MVEVVVQVTADDLTLTVTDDGCPHRSSPEVALSQLRARAQQLGGSCHLVRDDRRHTVLEWHVPLAA